MNSLLIQEEDEMQKSQLYVYGFCFFQSHEKVTNTNTNATKADECSDKTYACLMRCKNARGLSSVCKLDFVLVCYPCAAYVLESLQQLHTNPYCTSLMIL